MAHVIQLNPASRQRDARDCLPTSKRHGIGIVPILSKNERLPARQRRRGARPNVLMKVMLADSTKNSEVV